MTVFTASTHSDGIAPEHDPSDLTETRPSRADALYIVKSADPTHRARTEQLAGRKAAPG